MIISRGRGYVFVHIPKTGGTAMAEALEARAMADDILIGDTEKAKRRKGRLKGLPAQGRVWKHSTLSDMAGVLHEDDLFRMMVFTLVRNPWDRVVSYYHWLRMQSFEHPVVGRAKSLDFNAFVIDDVVGSGLRQWPYARYVEGAKSPIFIRLEHFAQDISPVEAHLGFSIELPRRNVSERRREWRSYYDAQTQDRIATLCANDIAQFHYEF